MPEDVINYYIEVYDNDNVRGPKVGRSQIFSLRLPSLEEVFARADSEQEQAIDDLEKDYLGGCGTRGYGKVRLLATDGSPLADQLRAKAKV